MRFGRLAWFFSAALEITLQLSRPPPLSSFPLFSSVKSVLCPPSSVLRLQHAFFQMGTISFMRSMSHWQAANASPR